MIIAHEEQKEKLLINILGLGYLLLVNHQSTHFSLTTGESGGYFFLPFFLFLWSAWLALVIHLPKRIKCLSLIICKDWATEQKIVHLFCNAVKNWKKQTQTVTYTLTKIIVKVNDNYLYGKERSFFPAWWLQWPRLHIIIQPLRTGYSNKEILKVYCNVDRKSKQTGKIQKFKREGGILLYYQSLESLIIPRAFARHGKKSQPWQP